MPSFLFYSQIYFLQALRVRLDATLTGKLTNENTELILSDKTVNIIQTCDSEWCPVV